MHVTMWGEYGIHCCTFLAGLYPQHVAATAIAEGLEIEVPYTHQILHRLRQAGIVESSRGPRGGYGLSRPASQISLWDVLMAAEGETFRLVCDSRPIQERCGGGHRCGLQDVWAELRDSIDTVLQRHTIASLLGRTAVEQADLVQIQPSVVGSVQRGNRG